MRAPLALLLATLLSLASVPAFALTGATGVRVSAHCGGKDATVTIESDPGLHDAMLVTGDAGRIEAPPGGHGEASVELACTSDAAMTVTVPRDAGFHVAIDGIGDADWHLGELAGHLDAELRGSGDLQARALPGGFTISSFASGDVSVAHAGGDAEYHGRGSGSLTVDAAQLGTLLVDTIGSGDAKVASGHVGGLNVQVRGSSDVTIGADAQTADLSSYGSGDIDVARVAGHVTQSHGGSGTITVNGHQGEHVTINWDENAAHDAVVTDGAGHSGHIPGAVAATFGRAVGWVFHLVLLVVFLVVVVAIVRVVRRHRAGLPAAGRATAARAGEPRVAELAALLARVATRAQHLETYVTSKEFELHRGFRELGD